MWISTTLSVSHIISSHLKALYCLSICGIALKVFFFISYRLSITSGLYSDSLFVAQNHCSHFSWITRLLKHQSMFSQVFSWISSSRSSLILLELPTLHVSNNPIGYCSCFSEPCVPCKSSLNRVLCSENCQ